MNIGGFTATSVWNAAVRSLTNFGVALLFFTLGKTTIAIASQVDLRTLAGSTGALTVSAICNVAFTGQLQIGSFDGTNFIPIQQTQSATLGIGQEIGITSTVGPMVKNTDAAQTGSYMYSGFRLVQ